MAQEYIEITGARENNLKSVSLRIPKRKITIFIGVSDSGKSSLVFDTIAMEAQRLLAIIDRIVDEGNTMIVIEHNLDVIRNADWIVDLGPEGGNRGGPLRRNPAEPSQGKELPYCRLSLLTIGRNAAVLRGRAFCTILCSSRFLTYCAAG